MKDRKSLSNKLGDFLAGKGFYVVLFVCTAVIGVSAWILLSTGNGADNGGTDALADISDSQEVMVSAGGDIGEAMTSDAVEGRTNVSPTPPALPSATAKPSPSPSPSAPPKDNSNSNKASTAEGGDAEEAMSKDPVFVWPLVGDIKVIYATDELLYSKTMADWRTHDGVDIAGTLGAKVIAVADGKVTEVKNDDLLGTVVVIDHGKGLCSIYANLTAAPVVKVGDKVAMGSVIGGVGDTAISEVNEVSHLHFAMTKDGKTVNPTNYLPKR